MRAGALCGCLFLGEGLLFFKVAALVGVALHSELGAHMAPKKPRLLQAASFECTPQRWDVTQPV